jgi:hypothetical protein
MRSFAEIIMEKGGPRAVADRLGVKIDAVRQWKFRDAIPRQHWPELIGAYRDLSMKLLLELEARKR